jgi:hypothetical protein
MRAERNEETNIPLVAVIPIKTPSQIKATQPATGMSQAHQRYSREVSIT